MKPRNQHSHFYQTGFSLVELLVGLVIGLLATLVIMQVFSIFEGQKRTTTGVADAQTNGSIALYTLARDLQIAGFDLQPAGVATTADSPFECATLNINPATGFDPANPANPVSDTPAAGYNPVNPVSDTKVISPAVITDGSTLIPASPSDTITLHYGSSDFGGVSSVIRGVPVGNNVSPTTSFGCQPFDVALIFNGSACDLVGVAQNGVTPAAITLKTLTPNAVDGANFSCLGAWREVTYKVNNNNLERNGVQIISNIVNIQAQYGISAVSSSNQIVQWVDATGVTWAASSVANRNRIKSIRVAIVARNGLLEKEDVSTDCTDLTSNNPIGVCAWSATSLKPANPSPAPHVDLSKNADGSNNPDWARYRYRVFETVIPLRNVVWAQSTL